MASFATEAPSAPRATRSTAASRAREVSRATKVPSATKAAPASKTSRLISAFRRIKPFRPSKRKQDGIPFLVLLPDELLLIVAKYLGTPSDRQHIDALAALCLTGNHRLLNFFEPLLYELSGKEGHPCAIQWAAAKDSVVIMSKAVANGVDLQSLGGGTYRFDFHNSLGFRRICYPVDPKPLELAVMHGNIACVEYLLQNKADIHQETEARKCTVVHYATETPRCRLLFWAIRYNQLNMVDFLLARGVDGTLLSTQAPEFKPMHLASALHHLELFDILLGVPGSAIDDADRHGQTSLHYASQGTSSLHYSECASVTGDAYGTSIQSLLQRGADTTLGEHFHGLTALEYSMFDYDNNYWDRSQAAFLLLAAEPKTFIPSDRLIVSAMRCAQKPRDGRDDAFFRRLFAGQPVSRLYPTGNGELRMYSGWDCTPWYSYSPGYCTSLLIWSIVEIRGRRGYTTCPFWADKLPELLLNIGATPHLADSRGSTPLHACIFVSLSELSDDDEKWDDETSDIFSQATPHRERPFPYNVIAELVLRNGSLDAQDEDGHTPLDYALIELDKDQDEERRELVSWYAWRVTRFALRVAYQSGMCPSAAVKTRLMERLGQDIVHPGDPLADKGASSWDNLNPLGVLEF